MEQPTMKPENNTETIKEKIEKLENLLADKLDDKIYMTHMGHGNMYSLGNWHTEGSHVISGREPDVEEAELFADLYGKYLDSLQLGEERKYDVPARPLHNAVTQESAEAASFTLREFLNDLKSL